MPQSECCVCTFGPGHFCSDRGEKYLSGTDCLHGVLYTCAAKDLKDHCAMDTCVHSEGVDHCPGGFF